MSGLDKKNPPEDGRFCPKHVKDDTLKNVNIINHTGWCLIKLIYNYQCDGLE
jgi:hypothetical protein